MIRHLLLATLLATIALTGCSRKSETNDPDKAVEPTQQTETEVVEETTITETDSTDTSSDENNTGAASATGDSAESPNSEGQLICTTEWFEWVNQQVMSTQSEAIAEQYPTGLPDVGSAEWFTAVDKLTGGDGAHGPDGGSDEWCSMIQQRLGNND